MGYSFSLEWEDRCSNCGILEFSLSLKTHGASYCQRYSFSLSLEKDRLSCCGILIQS